MDPIHAIFDFVFLVFLCYSHIYLCERHTGRPAGGRLRRAGGWAVVPTPPPLVSTPPPTQDCYPALRGTSVNCIGGAPHSAAAQDRANRGKGGRGEFPIFFRFFFGPQNCLKLFPRALGGPGDHFPTIFRPFLAIFGPPRGNFFSGPGPYFSPLFSLSWAAATCARARRRTPGTP